MKKHNILPFFTDLLLICLLTFGSLGCLCTAFDMRVENYFALICVLWAILCLICLRRRRGWLLLLGLLTLYGLRFWYGEHTILFSQMLQFIGSHYFRAYGWDPGGWFSAAEPYLGLLDMTECYLAMGLVSIFITALVLRYRLPAVCCMPTVLLPLALCLVITDSVPHALFIYLLILGLLLLVLTHNTRRKESAEGAKLTATVLLPAALALLILFNLYPQNTYEAPRLEDSFFAFLLPKVDGPPVIDPSITNTDPTTQPPVTVPPVSITGSRVDLDRIGPQTQSLRQAMTVTADYSGLMYLRGRSYGDYMGIMWDTDSTVDTQTLALDKDYAIWQLAGYGGPTTFTVSIQDRYRSDIQYVPYYPLEGVSLSYGSVLNANGGRQYSYQVIRPMLNWQRNWLADGSYEQRVSNLVSSGVFVPYSDYTQLTEKTRNDALALLAQEGIDSSMFLTDAAREIGNFVRGSAVYSLNTQYMPDSEMDFALWFLRDSDTGYCVHFASAAVVLLRSMGIPARYVEGYVANLDTKTTDGKFTDVVLEKNAHAWAEYYVPDVGWMILEATPDDGYIDDPQPTAPSTSTQQPTLPPPTEPSSSATVPPETGTVSQTATVPASTQGPQRTQPDIPDWVWQTALGVAAVMILLLLQWLLRLKLRFIRLQKGDPNRRALRCWHYGKRLCRILRLPQPEALLALAQKAKFSRQGVTEQELSEAFTDFMDTVLASVRQKNGLLRLLCRLVLAL